jgi:Fe-S cluster assembly protein SufB
VVEVVALDGSSVQYTTIQNWSDNVYNLVTKRAHAYRDASVFWLDCNMGSRTTMKYPCVCLVGEHARAEIMSLAFAGRGQVQDSGGKVFHMAPNTSSVITSKSICRAGGRASYRGLLRVFKGSTGSKASVRCDALLLDAKSRSDTYPEMDVREEWSSVGHEATVGKIGEAQLFYLMSRGLSESEALSLVVLGFVEAFTKRLPLEYSVELSRLIEMDMEGAVG